MKTHFSIADEPALFSRFAGSCLYPRQERCHFKRFAEVFREICPGESPLNHTDCTVWVPAWLARARMRVLLALRNSG